MHVRTHDTAPAGRDRQLGSSSYSVTCAMTFSGVFGVQVTDA